MALVPSLYARPAAQPAENANTTARKTASLLSSFVTDASLSAQPDGLPAPPVKIRQLDRLEADSENLVAALDHIALFTVDRNAAFSVGQHRNLSLLLREFPHAAELQRNRRNAARRRRRRLRYHWPRRRHWHRRRQRRRLRLEAERVPILAARLRLRTLERVEPDDWRCETRCRLLRSCRAPHVRRRLTLCSRRRRSVPEPDRHAGQDARQDRENRLTALLRRHQASGGNRSKESRSARAVRSDSPRPASHRR